MGSTSGGIQDSNEAKAVCSHLGPLALPYEKGIWPGKSNQEEVMLGQNLKLCYVFQQHTVLLDVNRTTVRGVAPLSLQTESMTSEPKGSRIPEHLAGALWTCLRMGSTTSAGTCSQLAERKVLERWWHL